MQVTELAAGGGGGGCPWRHSSQLEEKTGPQLARPITARVQQSPLQEEMLLKNTSEWGGGLGSPLLLQSKTLRSSFL